MSELTKAEEAYLYIIKNMAPKENFGKTLFYKMLYFSDFDFFELNEKSITGSAYRKIRNGPAPCDFDRVINQLKAAGYVREIKSATDARIKFALIKEPEFINLTKEERSTLDKSIGKLGGMSATQVSNYSHQDMPYKATVDGELIDYKLVFYRNPLFSVK